MPNEFPGYVLFRAVMTRLTDYPQVPQYSLPASWSFLARLLNTDTKILTDHLVTTNWWDACASSFVPPMENNLKRYYRHSFKIGHSPFPTRNSQEQHVFNFR